MIISPALKRTAQIAVKERSITHLIAVYFVTAGKNAILNLRRKQTVFAEVTKRNCGYVALTEQECVLFSPLPPKHHCITWDSLPTMNGVMFVFLFLCF